MDAMTQPLQRATQDFGIAEKLLMSFTAIPANPVIALLFRDPGERRAWFNATLGSLGFLIFFAGGMQSAIPFPSIEDTNIIDMAASSFVLSLYAAFLMLRVALCYERERKREYVFSWSFGDPPRWLMKFCGPRRDNFRALAMAGFLFIVTGAALYPQTPFLAVFLVAGGIGALLHAAACAFCFRQKVLDARDASCMQEALAPEIGASDPLIDGETVEHEEAIDSSLALRAAFQAGRRPIPSARRRPKGRQSTPPPPQPSTPRDEYPPSFAEAGSGNPEPAYLQAEKKHF